MIKFVFENNFPQPVATVDVARNISRINVSSLNEEGTLSGNRVAHVRAGSQAEQNKWSDLDLPHYQKLTENFYGIIRKKVLSKIPVGMRVVVDNNGVPIALTDEKRDSILISGGKDGDSWKGMERYEVVDATEELREYNLSNLPFTVEYESEEEKIFTLSK